MGAQQQRNFGTGKSRTRLRNCLSQLKKKKNRTKPQQMRATTPSDLPLFLALHQPTPEDMIFGIPTSPPTSSPAEHSSTQQNRTFGIPTLPPMGRSSTPQATTSGTTSPPTERWSIPWCTLQVHLADQLRRLRSNKQNIHRWRNFHLFRDVCCPAHVQWQNLSPLLCILSRYCWVAFYDSHRCHRVRRFCVWRALWIERFWRTKRWYSSNLIKRTSELDIRQLKFDIGRTTQPS